MTVTLKAIYIYKIYKHESKFVNVIDVNQFLRTGCTRKNFFF